MNQSQDTSPIPVRSGEWPLVIAASLFAFLAVALAIFIRTWSDAAFLGKFDVAFLPVFFAFSAVVFLPTTAVYTWLSKRIAPVVLNTMLIVFFVLLSVGATQFDYENKWFVFGVVLALAIVSPLVNVICWNTIVERMDSRKARRLIPFIGGCGTLGAVGAGLLGAGLVDEHGTKSLLWAIALILVILIPFPRWVAQTWHISVRGAKPKQNVRDGIKALAEDPLVRVIAAATFLMAITTNMTDFHFKAFLQSDMAHDDAAIAAFLARFHGFTNLAILFIQFLVAAPTIRRFGLGFAYSLHPAAVLVGGLLCLVNPILWTAVMLRFADTLMKFTFHSDTNEMVLTPLPFIKRGETKVLMKGVIYPIGGLVAAAFLQIMIATGETGNILILLCLCVMALGWFFSTRKVRGPYLSLLSSNLAIEVKPGRTQAAEVPEVLVDIVREYLVDLRDLRRKLRRDPNDAKLNAEIRAAVTEMFEHIGELIGDRTALAGATQRFLHGDAAERSQTVELIESMLREHKLGEAGELLDSLVSESTSMRALSVPTEENVDAAQADENHESKP